MNSRTAAFTVALLLPVIHLSTWPPAARPTGAIPHRQPDVIARSRARCAALKSYADNGTVISEMRSPGAPPVVERTSFVTYYRAPRQYFFDFRKGAGAGGERLVIWCDGGDLFNTWWSATKVHETYPKGSGATAFAVTAFPTNGRRCWSRRSSSRRPGSTACSPISRTIGWWERRRSGAAATSRSPAR
jgi:hypothetical protein